MSGVQSGKRPVVLMVTGAYDPEVSGGGLQCQAIVSALQHRMEFIILSVSSEFTHPRVGTVNGIPVYRIPVDATRLRSKIGAGIRLTWVLIQLRRRFTLVHFHGFSEKTILLILLSKLLRTRTVLTLHTATHDEPAFIRSKGRLAFWCYAQADFVVGVSPYLQERYLAFGLPATRFQLIPGGIDLARFHPPVGLDERQRLRQELRLPEGLPLILFVGFFSHDKCPHVLFNAWSRLQQEGRALAGLIFVGATHSRYFEVNPHLADEMRVEARRLNLTDRVRFIETTHEIEKFYRAVDIFVLPSIRESMSMALVEAMGCGLACIASRLPGVTDELIAHQENGLLIPAGDARALEDALRFLLEHPAQAQRFGQKAQAFVAQRYSITQTAARYLDVYRQLSSGRDVRDELVEELDGSCPVEPEGRSGRVAAPISN